MAYPHPNTKRDMTSRRSAPVLSLVPVAALLVGCVTFPGVAGRTLQEEIDAVVLEPPLDQVNWGVLVVDPERGEILYSRNSHRKFVPASNMKVLATSTAISLLGSDYRFQTELWGVGELRRSAGTLEGDLVLRATGDPTLSHRFYPSAEAPLDSLASRLRNAGVQEITGALVVDASAWDSTTVPESWMVGNLPSRSAATGGAFAIGEGEIVVEVTAGPSDGDPARARWWPSTPPDFFSAAFVTVSPDSSARREVHYLPESRRLLLEGHIPLGAVDTFSIAQRDPVTLATSALVRALERQGIHLHGGVRMAWDPGQPLGPGGCVSGRAIDWEALAIPPEERPAPVSGMMLPDCPDGTRLAGLTSPPMGDMVEGILEPSQNWMTEQLVHALGMELGTRGSWPEGFRVEERFLTREVGVDSLDLHFRDGSGLSAYNLVTPRAMVRILEFMRGSSNADLYRHALAEPGEEESTLENRLSGLEGRLFAKTGTISHVNSLSGYLTTATGRELIFSILTNGSGLSSSVVRQGMDEVVRIIARR